MTKSEAILIVKAQDISTKEKKDLFIKALQIVAGSFTTQD